MKFPRRILVLCCLLVPAAASAQEAQKKVVPPEGTQAFRNILHQFDLKPVKTLAELADRKPEETVLIVFGNTAILEQIGSLETFRAKGGAILIASDRDDKGRLREWQLHISGAVITEDTKLAYKGMKDCPKVTRPRIKPHVVLEGVNQGLATNRPSLISLGQSDFRTLAAFSSETRVDGFNFAGFLMHPFLVGRERVLVMAGHSVFMNVLLAQPDIDNYIFAQNCVRWLKEGKRKYALFVEDGRIAQEFDVRLTVLPPIPMPPTQVLNRLLRGLENENFFNRLLARIPRDRILRGILLLVTVVLLVYGCKRLISARHRIETAVPLLTPLPSPVPPVELTLATQRQQALLQGGNLREPARDLARFFFEELAPLPNRHLDENQPPPYDASGNWLERRWLARQIPYLWQLAYGDPGRISKRQFAGLPAILDRLAEICRAGRLRFESRI
jgi:hypothetical protein